MTHSVASWLTPALPGGATALSVGMSIFAVGELTLDGFALCDHDTTPPAVAITTPADGAAVNGTVTLTASASDAGGIRSVTFLVNGVTLSGTVTSTVDTYSLSWDTTTVPDSTASITARAYDIAGDSADSSSILVRIANMPPPDTTAPDVVLTAPPDGSSVRGVVPVRAAATDDVAVQQVSFLVDGKFVASDDTSPYETSWERQCRTDSRRRLDSARRPPSYRLTTSSCMLARGGCRPPVPCRAGSLASSVESSSADAPCP